MELWLKALNIAIFGPRGGGMFGTDLRTQIRREACVFFSPMSITQQRRGRDCVPIIVQKCVERIRDGGMLEVGIFRLSGRQSRVKELKDSFNSGWIVLALFVT